MTKEEARSLIGRTVLYTSAYGGEPEKVVITGVGVCLVGISWPDSGRRHFAVSGELMSLPEEGSDPLIAVQACLNNFAAAPIRTTLNSEQTEAVLSALRELNWAAGLDFEGVPPAPVRSITRVPRRKGRLPCLVAGSRAHLQEERGRERGGFARAHWA